MSNKLNKKFDSYGFKDTHGHDLLACVDFQELVRDAETLRKARTVLADWSEHVEDARQEAKQDGALGMACALVELADALGGDV